MSKRQREAPARKIKDPGLTNDFTPEEALIHLIETIDYRYLSGEQKRRLYYALERFFEGS